MRCLSVEQCRAWIASAGLRLDDNLWIRTPEEEVSPPPYYVVIKGFNLNLSEFSRRLFDWMPVGRERLLIVSNWSSYPPDQKYLFETIRRGCGISQTLEEAPGHLFVSTKTEATWYDDRPLIDVEEESLAMWLMALMLEWTWDAYALVEGCRDAVRLGDEFVEFLTTDPERREAANSLIGQFGLTSRDTFPWGSAPMGSVH